MAFRFKMQKILDYREQLEEEAKVRLARVQQMYIEEERRFEELRLLLQEKETQFYQNISMDAGERWLLESFIKGLRADITESQLRLRSLHQMMEEARRELLHRAKERKVLDKLKERQKEHYQAEEREKERKTNDETATLRYKAAAF